MTMLKEALIFPFSLFIVLCVLASLLSVEAAHGNASAAGRLVQKHEREPLVVTEFGEISAVNVRVGTRDSYHLQFITLEPNSIFLPVLLHANMVFYVHTGSGTLSWADDNEMNKVNIRKGDVYRLSAGSVFYVQSSLEPEGEKLRIHAIFSNTEDNIYEPSIGAYSGISDLVLSFNSKVLQATFKAPEDVIEEIVKATKPPAIINVVPKKEICEWQARLLKAFLGSNRDGFDSINGKKKKKKKKKKKTEAFNVLEADPDFKNCNGWSLTVDKNELSLLRDSHIGVFMVNLTKGSMMRPHWNPRASEIAMVLQGQGMIRVVCSSNANESECENLRFRVKEGDVFTVPRFQPTAQMSFNNDSFVFMGFSTSTNRNHPQFLAGKSSVLGVLDRQILAVSFNVTNTTIDKLLTPQNESVILDCASCAEEEESKMEEEIESVGDEEEAEKRKEEEEKKRREEEARKEQEEARRQEEERKKKKQRRRKEGREHEEPKRKEEKGRQEERRKKEKAAAREQEEAKGQEKERQRRAEQEEDRREREMQIGEPEKRETEEWQRVQKKSSKESMEDFLVLSFA